MSAGHIVNGQCVDVAASLDSFYGVAPVVQTSGNPAYLSIINKSASGWMQDTYQNGTLISSVAAPTPLFADCDTTASFVDGHLLGWGVVAAMVVAWSIHVLRRGI